MLCCTQNRPASAQCPGWTLAVVRLEYPPPSKKAPLPRRALIAWGSGHSRDFPRIRARRRTAAGCVQLGHRTTTPGIRASGPLPGLLAGLLAVALTAGAGLKLDAVGAARADRGCAARRLGAAGPPARHPGRGPLPGLLVDVLTIAKAFLRWRSDLDARDFAERGSKI